MNRTIALYGIVFSCFSLLVTLLVLFLHFWIKKLRKYPGQYIVIQCILQVFYDFHWISTVSYIYDRPLEKSWCEVLAAVYFMTYNLGLCYTFVLGLELLVKIKKVSSIAYYKRSIIYHFFSISITTIIGFTILFLDGYGITNYGTCGIGNKRGGIIEFFPRSILMISLIILSILLLTSVKKYYSRLIWNYCLVIISVIFTWGLPGMFSAINFFYTNEYLIISGYFIGTLSGTIVGFCRVFNSKILREVSKKLMSKEKRKALLYKDKRFCRAISNIGSLNEILIRKDLKQANTTSINCYSDFFENLSRKLKLEIFTSLFIYFTQDYQSFTCETHPNRKKGITINSDDLNNFEYLLKESEMRYLKNAQTIIVEYKPETFRVIRESLGHNNSTFIKTLQYQLDLSYDEAKVIENSTNSSFVIITSDSKYVIKSITKDEKRVFFRFLLENYSKRILECPESRLIRILGVFGIATSKVVFMVMENTALLEENDLVYDLKGSSVDRFVKPVNGVKNQVLKDENFKISGKKVKVSLQESTKLISTIKDDLKILKDAGIMDYSLLLVVKSSTKNQNRYSVGLRYHLAIIDLFQVFNGQKAFERWFKIWVRRVDKKMVSVVSPGDYYSRILDFLQEMFCEDSQEFSIIK